MNKNTGIYTKIRLGEASYTAFVPNKLGAEPSFELDIGIINLLSEANRFIGKLDEITDILIFC